VLPYDEITYEKPASAGSDVIETVEPDDPVRQEAYKYAYTNTTAVGYYGEVTNNNYPRKKPVAEIQDARDAFPLPEGLQVAENARYPKYGSSMNSVLGNDPDGKKAQARTILIAESGYLCAYGTSNANTGAVTPDKYTWMDEDGWLYQGTRAEPVHALEKSGDSYDGNRRLYKHTASVGLYLGDVDDNAPGVVKKLTMRPRGYNSYGVTGLYAPAGEVIKVELSGKDMDATGGIVLHIGQALYNGQANNIWTAKGQMQRIPHLLNTMSINKNTAVYDENTDTWTGYIGSFIGGPIYIRNEGVTYSTVISGAVEYLHFILGSTSKDEFERLKKSSTVPYFDLEVWHYGVLHTGPRRYAESFTYDDLYKAAILWEKVSSVTTTGSSQGVVFLYDPFVAAGAAVAFPGRSSVNCPMGWMSSSLNYNSIVTSGSWGNFHEYHHNFQGYGVGNGGEVTNNGMTLVSYALFTKISAKRGIGSFGAQGLGGWNNYTSATWALEEVLKIARPDENPSNGNQGLSLYATLLHNFGAESYIRAKVAGGGQSYAAYMNAWQKTTHNNMYYYFNDILRGTGIENNAESEYPMFVPVSCVYQTGRSYMYDGTKRYISTMRPYIIPYGSDFKIDLSRYTAVGGQYSSGSIVMPEGFSYTVKSVTEPARGSVEVTDGYNIVYKPDKSSDEMRSGEIIVTLAITKDDKAFSVDDVDLILEFEQSHETNKLTLERTTYTYTAETMYKDAVTAFDSGFAGYETVTEQDHFNPTQNCNTDIWFRPDTDKYHQDYPNDPDKYFIHDNNIEVIDSKMYFEDDGKYRVYLRGRTNCALYFSADGIDYNLGAKIAEETAPKNSWLFRPGDANTYFDIEFDEGKVTVTVYIGGEKNTKFSIANTGGSIENWLYIKEILIVQKSSNSYIGVGMSQWTHTMFTMSEAHYKADGTAVEDSSDDEYAYSETTYRDYSGVAVACVRTHKNGTNEYFKIVNGTRTASTSEEVAELTASKLIAPSATKQPSYVNTYRSSYKFPDNSSYESDYFYMRNYNYNYVGDYVEYSTWDADVKLVESNFVKESASYGIENLFAEGTTTFIHNAPNTSAGVFITLDMGKTIDANSIIFLGRTPQAATTAHQGLPNSFKLEISTDGVNFEDAGTFTNKTGAAHSATVALGKTLTFRYVKITIESTHSNTGRLILSGIKFGYAFTLKGNGSNHIMPTNDNVVYLGNWEYKSAASFFGMLYVGEADSRITFDIKGTRLAVITSKAYSGEYEVYIDGVKVDSTEVANSTDVSGITYLSERLSSGSHSVEIRCKGKVGIDSFAVYDEG